jgi:2'-5' RNA ligase
VSKAAHRLFFALWPEAGLRKSLHQLGRHMRTRIGGRVVSADRIHLTLAFLGDVPVARIDTLCAIGESIRGKRFELELTRAGCWKRGQVGWIAPTAMPAAFEQLVSALRQCLSESGFSADEKPFAPHVTLLRKASCQTQPEQPEAPYRWRVADFSLIRSRTLPTGPAYSTLMSWPLS